MFFRFYTFFILAPNGAMKLIEGRPTTLLRHSKLRPRVYLTVHPFLSDEMKKFSKDSETKDQNGNASKELKAQEELMRQWLLRGKDSSARSDQV